MLKYTRVYADGDGESHFEDVQVEVTYTEWQSPF